MTRNLKERHMSSFWSFGRALGLFACVAAAALGPTAAVPAPAGGERAAPAEATPPAKADAAAAARRDDLAAFRSKFFEREKSYSPEARAEAERRLAKLE